jgi:hypothetical protein
MCRSIRIGVFSRFWQGVGDKAVLGGWRERAYSGGVWRRRNCMDKAHVANVVQVYFLLEHNGKALSVESDGQYGRREGEFADDGCPLMRV